MNPFYLVHQIIQETLDSTLKLSTNQGYILISVDPPDTLKFYKEIDFEKVTFKSEYTNLKTNRIEISFTDIHNGIITKKPDEYGKTWTCCSTNTIKGTELASIHDNILKAAQNQIALPKKIKDRIKLK